VARGQVLADHLPGLSPPTGTVRVPITVASEAAPQHQVCFYVNPLKPVGHCAAPLQVNPQLITVTTYVARYPPLYYGLTGLPSLFSGTTLGLWGMRLMSAFIGAIFLGLAFAAGVRWSSMAWLPLVVVFAATPMVLYDTSVLNPNGFEIATAVCAWTTAAIVVLEYERPTPSGLIWSCVVAMVACAFTRPLSWLWMVVVIVALVILRPRAAPALWANRQIRAASAAALVGLAGAAAYVLSQGSLLVEHFPLPPGVSNGAIAEALARGIPTWIAQFVGSYGSPNFGGPALSQVLWLVAASLLLVGAGVAGRGWPSVWLAVFTIGAVGALPFVATYTHARLQGLGWQGRYNYPVAVGAGVMAAWMLSRRFRLPVAGRAALLTVWTVVQGGGLYWVIRRYGVGLDGPLNPFGRVTDHWSPPLGLGVEVVLGAMAIVVCASWFAYASTRRSGGLVDGTTGHPGQRIRLPPGPAAAACGPGADEPTQPGFSPPLPGRR
jgi:hypothetical protein